MISGAPELGNKIEHDRLSHLAAGDEQLRRLNVFGGNLSSHGLLKHINDVLGMAFERNK